MATYTITETVMRTVTLEADSEDDAREKFFEVYYDDITEEYGDIEITEVEEA